MVFRPEMGVEEGLALDFTGVQSVEGCLESDVVSVGAVLVLLSDPPSKEFNVEAMLCLEGVRRRKLTGLDGADKPGLSVTDLVDEVDPAQNLPRNREAAACRSGSDPIFPVAPSFCASLKLVSSA